MYPIHSDLKDVDQVDGSGVQGENDIIQLHKVILTVMPGHVLGLNSRIPVQTASEDLKNIS